MDHPCDICGTPVPRSKNSVVCSDRCLVIRQAILDLDNKYFPCHGCDNCWGDLHGRCSQQCRDEFAASLAFMKDVWAFVRLVYPREKTPTKAGA